MKLIEKTGGEAAREKAMLASGERPVPRLAHKVQRTAAKALAVFFVLVLAFTLLSRMAVGIAVARVSAEKGKAGILTQRTTVSGSISTLGDLELTLPGGIRVTGIPASVGQRVQAGDTLLELDGEGLASAVEKLENDLALLDLKIAGAAKGNTGANTDAVLNAQTALDQAREDYERLRSGRTTAEARTEEDLLQARADCDEAAAELEKAKVKAKQALVDAAREKLDAAKEVMETTGESARDAEDSAKQALESAQDQESTADSAYFSALNAYNRADEALKQAQADYDGALAGGDETAIAAAKSALDQARSARDSAENTMNSLSDSSSAAYRAVKRAKENLKAVQEKWAEKVKEAEADVAEAEQKLAEAQKKTDMSEEALVISAQSALDSAERTLKSAQRSTEDAATATADQLLTAQRAVDSAQRALEQARRTAENERLTNQSARRQAEIERLGYVNERREIQKKLDELRDAASAGGRLTAPVDGVVLFLPDETGLTAEGAKVAALSRSDKGFTFTGKASREEAEKLAVGDEGQLTFTHNGKSREATISITAIGAAGEDGQVEVTALLPEGDWPAGVSAKLELSKRSERYDVCLPLGALRSDADGKYVLVLREKQTVMGAELTVEKVPVTVKGQDSQLMAVDAPALGYDDRVVTSASKPIAQGDRVRLEESGE